MARREVRGARWSVEQFVPRAEKVPDPEIAPKAETVPSELLRVAARAESVTDPNVAPPVSLWPPR